MHNSCGGIFSRFCGNIVLISESILTMCYEINDFKPTFFSNFLIFRTEADNDNGREGGDVAKDAGRKEEKG